MAAARTSGQTARAPIAAHESWAQASNWAARTAPTPAALAGFEREVATDGLLDPAGCARHAGHTRQAHPMRPALRSACARRKALDLTAEAYAAHAELAEGGAA